MVMKKSLEKTKMRAALTTYDRTIRPVYFNFDKDCRHYSWDIWVYLKMNPELLRIGDNQKICDYIRELHIRYMKKRTHGWSDEKTACFLDYMSDMEANYYKGSLKESLIYHCSQDEINLFHPDLKGDKSNLDFLMLMAHMHAMDKRDFDNTYEKLEEDKNSELDAVAKRSTI